MAINKRAQNIIIEVENTHTSISGSREINTERLFIFSKQEDLELISNKKIVAQSNQKE